jgi:DNA-binding IclR family transcriptional regulator
MVLNSGTNGAQTVDRALEALALIVSEGRLLSLDDIMVRLRISKSATYRLLRSLESAGLIARDRSAGGYGIGARFLSLSVIAANRIDVRGAARPAMERIVSHFGETASLHVRNGDRRVCVEVVEGLHAVRRVVPVGETLPLYAGETGRALMSGISESELANILQAAAAAGLDPRRIQSDLPRIREQGYYIGIGLRTAGVGSISAPIYGALGVAGALTVSGPANRWNTAAMRASAPFIVREMQNVSRSLGAAGADTAVSA